MKKAGAIAAITALLCGVVIYLYLNSVEERIEDAKAEREIEMTEIVVASCLIPPYTEITEDMLRLEQFPAEYVKKQTVRAFEEVIGLRSDGTIVEGQTLLSTMFGTAEDVGASLSCQVPEGMRAMTLPVDVNAGMGGYISRGDLVDVLLYLPTEPTVMGDGGKERITTVALSGVMVLRVGDVCFDTNEAGLYSNVTLALTPEECLQAFSALEQAQKDNGAIYLTLRARGDSAETDRGIYSAAELLHP